MCPLPGSAPILPASCGPGLGEKGHWPGDHHRPPPRSPAGLRVRAIGYQAGEQPRTSVQKILPDPEPSLWVNLNRDEFRRQRPGPGRVPGASCWPALRSRALVTEFEAGRAHIWVSFALGAAPAFFAAPLAAAADELVPLADLWGQVGRSLRDRLLAAAAPQDMLQIMEQVLLGQQAEQDRTDLRGVRRRPGSVQRPGRRPGGRRSRVAGPARCAAGSPPGWASRPSALPGCTGCAG